MYIEVDEWYTTVCHMISSKVEVKVKVKVTEVRKLRKRPISNVISSSNLRQNLRGQ